MLPVEQPLQEFHESPFIALRRREPTCLLFAFARSLDGVVLHPLDEAPTDTVKWPAPEERLIKHVFVRTRWAALTSCGLDQVRVEASPLSNRLQPLLRQFGQAQETSARIFSAFGIVGGGCRKTVRKSSRARSHAIM